MRTYHAVCVDKHGRSVTMIEKTGSPVIMAVDAKAAEARAVTMFVASYGYKPYGVGVREVRSVR